MKREKYQTQRGSEVTHFGGRLLESTPRTRAAGGTPRRGRTARNGLPLGLCGALPELHAERSPCGRELVDNAPTRGKAGVCGRSPDDYYCKLS